MKLRYLRRCALLGAATYIFLCDTAFAARFADAADDVARVYEVVDARMALINDVAAWKWSHQKPIFDAERERVVVDQTLAQARELGLAADPLRRVIEMQIQMARAIETECFEDWRQHGFPATRLARDLETDLRPALDSIGQELLASLYWAHGEFQRTRTTEGIAKALRHIATYPGVTAQDLSELRAALQEVRVDTTPVDVVTRLRVLRVGTTGDYAPFSFDHAGELQGLDIDLAEALATHLGLKVRFVRTTWTNLMVDLEAGRFDLALSGISNTPERAARGEFSTAYHFDGKTPIARCQDRTRFGSLSDIDRDQVRVIVNVGGTNQQFVQDHIEHAKIIVQQDNRAVFDEIIAGHADVMITDAIEVDLQTRRHKELCRTMAGTLTNSAKAAFLPKGSALTKSVDQWLQAEVARGAVEEKLQRAMKTEADSD